jgi:hypothetical protein
MILESTYETDSDIEVYSSEYTSIESNSSGGIMGKSLLKGSSEDFTSSCLTVSVNDMGEEARGQVSRICGLDTLPFLSLERVGCLFNSAGSVTHGHMDNNAYDLAFVPLEGAKYYLIWGYSTNEGFPGSAPDNIDVFNMRSSRVQKLIQQGFFPSIYRVGVGEMLVVKRGSFHAALAEQNSGHFPL